jgi:hypothetical protein
MTFFLSILPNILAMLTSLGAMILLVGAALRLGGRMGLMLKLVVAGVFFSVFLHAGAELAEVFGLLGEGPLFVLMGSLLSGGSLAFGIAGVVGIRALR